MARDHEPSSNAACAALPAGLADTSAQVGDPTPDAASGALPLLRTAELDRVRALVAVVAPASIAATGADVDLDENVFVRDLRTASVLVLAASFLVAMASAGMAAAAAVLDQRRTYLQPAMVGVPLEVLDRARMMSTQVPLLLLVSGSTVTGVVVAAPLTRLGPGGGGVDRRLRHTTRPVIRGREPETANPLNVRKLLLIAAAGRRDRYLRQP